jgi:flagellar hook-length control protein FliK
VEAAGTVEQTDSGQRAVDAARVVRQIVEAVTFRSEGASELTLRLSPEFLGHASIILTASPQGVSAKILVESETARHLLASHIAELQADLKASGVNMKSIDISKSDLSWDMARSNGGAGGDSARRDTRSGTDHTRREPSRVVALSRSRTAEMKTLAYEVNTPVVTGDDMGVDFRA